MQGWNRLFILLWAFLALTACSENEKALKELDELVSTRRSIQSVYQMRIDSLCSPAWMNLSDEERFAYCGQLFDMYRAFNMDSQLFYADKRYEIACLTNNQEYVQAARMNMSEVHMRYGMYYEACQLLDSVSAVPVAPAWRPYYYHLRRTLYGLMADFAATDSEQQIYQRFTQDYRDSLLSIQPEGSFLYAIIYADAMAAIGLYAEALDVLDDYVSMNAIEADETGIYAITKAQIYKGLGNHEEQKKQLIIASCADLKGAVREYVAIRELALLLYRQGDVDHAYRYMQCAVEDAAIGGMRGRTLEISTVYPIIESAYQKQMIAHRRVLYALLVSIACIAALMTLFFLYYARLNAQSNELNRQLQESNAQLRESNIIKEMYIGRYMETTSLLIDRFDNWRKALHQYSKNGDTKHLQGEIASHRFTQEQLNAFYHDFDESFLNIFPDFVERVKGLLVDGTEFRIKSGERLNTDLRVLCCIRLGITDSVQIASFLRYSLSTIYNSRTRMRNLAKGDRNQFEQKIASL